MNLSLKTCLKDKFQTILSSSSWDKSSLFPKSERDYQKTTAGVTEDVAVKWCWKEAWFSLLLLRVWMLPNQFNVYFSPQCSGVIDHGCICHQHKPSKVSSRTAAIGSSWDARSPRIFLCLQTPGGVTAVCWRANVPRQSFSSSDSPICHRICSLPTGSGPKLMSEQNIPAGWWILPASPFAASDRGVDFFPFPPSVAPLCPSHFHASVLYFFLQRNISQQGWAR